jgi:hypothetical protein
VPNIREREALFDTSRVLSVRRRRSSSELLGRKESRNLDDFRVYERRLGQRGSDARSHRKNSGMDFTWEDDAEVTVRIDPGPQVVIKANAAGLRSLAGILLVLAGDDAPIGAHCHLDPEACLETGSTQIVLERSTE